MRRIKEHIIQYWKIQRRFNIPEISPISYKDILRCVAAVGCNFKFLIDLSLAASTSLNIVDHSALCTYLRDASIDFTLVISVLQILIKDRRTAHRINGIYSMPLDYFKLDMLKRCTSRSNLMLLLEL